MQYYGANSASALRQGRTHRPSLATSSISTRLLFSTSQLSSAAVRRLSTFIPPDSIDRSKHPNQCIYWRQLSPSQASPPLIFSRIGVWHGLARDTLLTS